MRPATTRSGRAGRIALRIVLGVLALVTVTVAGALIALHTDWGREQLRARVQTALAETFVGDVTIGRVDGSVFDELIVRDVVIEDTDGQPAIRVAALRLELAILPLVRQQAHVKKVTVEGLVVHGRQRPDGSFNLTGLLKKAEKKSAWDIRLDGLSIAGAQIVIETPEQTVHLDDVRLAASATVIANGPLAARADLRARWRERAIDLVAMGDLGIVGEVVTIGSADVRAAELVLSARGLRIAGGQVTGEVVIDVPARASALLAPASPLSADLRLELSARPQAEGPAGATAVTVKGAVGVSPIEGVLTIEPLTPRVYGTLQAQGLDTRAMLRGAFPVALDVTIALDLAIDPPDPDAPEDAKASRRLKGVSALRGHVQATGNGRIADRVARDLDVRVELADGRATVKASGKGDGGTQVVVDAALAFLADGAINVERAHLVAHVDDLGDAAGDAVPADGTLDVDLTASGRVSAFGSDLAVRGHVDGRSLSYAATTARSLRVDVDAAGLPGKPRGRLSAELHGIVDRGRPLGMLMVDARSRAPGTIDIVAQSRPSTGPWAVDVAATVRIAPEVTTVALGKHRFRTRGVDWLGRGGVIEIRPASVQARGLRTTIAGGALAVDATYHLAGGRRGDLAAAVQLDGVDLAAVDRSLGLGPSLGDGKLALRGVVDGRADVARRRGRFSGSVKGSARGVAVRAGATPIDATLEARVAPGNVVRVEADVRGAGVGAFTMSLDLAAPRNFTDPRAWQRLERRAIRHGVIKIDGLDLGAAARLAGVEPAPATGRVDGELTLSATDSIGWLRVRNLEIPRARAPIDADLALGRVEAGVATVSLVATLRGVTGGRADATLRVPTHPFDLGAWARLDADAVRGATVRVDELVLNAETSRLLGLLQPWQGRASLVIEVAPGLRSATAEVEVRGLRGGPLARPADLRVEVDLDREGVALSVRGAIEGRWVLAADARVPITLEELQTRGLPALLAAPLEATLRIDQAPLSALRRTMGVEMPITGTLTASADVKGTVGAPTGEAELLLAGVGVDARHPVLRELRITAGYDGKLVRAEANGQQSDGGRLHITGRVDPRAPESARGTLEATRFDLAALVHLSPGRLLGIGGILDAEVRVEGADKRTAKVNGVVRVHQAHVPVGGNIGTLRHAEVEITLTNGALMVSVDGKVGAGKLSLRGRGQLDGLVPRTAEVDVTVTNVTLIGEVEPRLYGTADIRLRRDGELWRVKAVVSNGRVIVPESKGTKLDDPGLPGDLAFIENGRPPPAAAEPPDQRRLEIGVRPAKPLLIAEIELRSTSVRAEELRGALRGALTVTVGAESLAVDGHIEVASGTIDLFDRRYRIDRANVRFDGSVDPVLDIRLVHDFPELTLYATVRGRLSKPELQLSSQPGTYSEGQLLSFLLGGAPGAEPGRETRDAAASVASSLLSQKVGSYLDDYLPVDLDVLRYEAATSSDSAAVTIGKWVTRKLFVAYRRRLESPRPDQNAGEAELQYWLGRNLLLQGSVGDRGVHGIDLLWLRRW